MNKNFQEEIFRELELYFSPLKNASSDVDTLLNFIKTSTGWDINAISGGNNSTFLDDVRSVVDELTLLQDVYNNPPETFLEFIQAVDSISSLITRLQNIHTSLSGTTVPPDIADLVKDVFNQLTVIYLKGRFPNVYSVLLCFTIIDISDDPFRGYNNTVIKQIDYVCFKIYFDRISLLLKDPIGFLKGQYMPYGIPDQSTANQVGKKIFTNISYLLGSLNIPYLVGRGQGGQYLTAAEEAKLDGMLTLSKQFFIWQTGNTIEAGASIGLIPSSSANGSGAFIVPFGSLSLNKKIGNWTIKLAADSNIPGLEINENGISIYDNSNKKDVHINLLFEKSSENEDVFIIGAVEGTNLKVGGISIEAFLDAMDEIWNADVSVHIKNATFVLKPGDADNFLKKILPAEGISTAFELTVGYNSHRGLYFGGGAGLEVEIPVHQKILGIDFENVTLSIAVNPDGTIPVTANTSFNFSVGPIIASVRQVGLQANVTFPASGGNLGPIDMSLGFKSPSGIGIALESEMITGGGFLNYDEATATYTGGLELTFSKISLKAIGVLTTRMPDGSDGYSLLIIITAEFTPLQLGMGFTLNGVGGLLGLNRTVNTTRLSLGVRDNTLNSILFPQDIVKNANSIISNITQVFPVKKDRFLIGPMAKIGWGTPTLLTIDLGIVIEVPNPVTLVILGVVRAIVPSESNRIISIQVNFVGEINFGKKYLAFDASLFDSKILTFGLYGDMALRLYWGDKPNFLFSVGGFHPKFKTPPANTPQLRRLAVVLADSDNLKVRIETYLALTSNSAQFGARVDAMARAWKIRAVGAVWFDVLFQFAPFYFDASMGAMFAIKLGNSTVLSIHIDLTLQGPGPWRAQGRASFKIVLVRVNVSFDATFGHERVEPIEPVSIFGKLQDAVSNKDNWLVNEPKRDTQYVAFREIPTSQSNLVVDPFGTLRFSQKAVPLDVTLEKYGTARITDYNRFSVSNIELTQGGNLSTSNAEPVYDHFARNEFFYMTDDEKLSRESYELFKSGANVSNTSQVKSRYYVNREIKHKQIFIDKRNRFAFADTVLMSDAVFNASMEDNHITRSSSSPSSGRVFQGAPDKAIVTEEKFQFVDKNTASVVSSQPTDFPSYTVAREYLDGLLASNPSQASEYVIVNQSEM